MSITVIELNKNDLIISVDTEKAFDKIQHPFMIITQNKLSIEEMYLNIMKAVHDKPIVHIILNYKKLKVLSLRWGTRHSCLLLSLILNLVLTGSPSQSNLARKRKKSHSNKKGEIKLSPLAYDII